jgi:hypothetical protein
VVQRYNDWMARSLESGAVAPRGSRAHSVARSRRGAGRARRVAKAGLKGFHVDPFPDERGGKALWDPAYEPFWALVEETRLPMSFHIVGPRKQNVTETFSNPTPGIKETFIAIAPISICETVSTLVFTGILARHPKLRFVLVECGIGWIPYFLERMDQTFNKHRFWTKSIITEKPSEYWYRQGYATFIQDLAGVAERHRAGLKNVMWSTDYPHSDSTWPKSREALDGALQGHAGRRAGHDRRRELLGAVRAQLASGVRRRGARGRRLRFDSRPPASRISPARSRSDRSSALRRRPPRAPTLAVG